MKIGELCRMAQIFLVGYMGSGKSTTGKQLASRMHMPFFDLDSEVEASVGMPVSRIFETLGEAGFRGAERAALQRLTSTYTDLICATGGGTPCFYDNMQHMNTQGVTVYLEMDVKSIVYRLQHAKQERPLIAGKTEAELFVFVADHLQQREEFYNEAHIRFNALGMNRLKLDDLVARIRAVSAKP